MAGRPRVQFTPIVDLAPASPHVAACTLFLSAEAMRRAGRVAQARSPRPHAAAAASRDLLARLIQHLPAVVYTARIEPNLDCRRVYLERQYRAGDRLAARRRWKPADALEARHRCGRPRTCATPWRNCCGGRMPGASGRWCAPDGSRIWVRRHARIAERFPDGSAELVGTITDITRERTLAAQVQASAKLATLGEMMADLAHELGQPAATMCLAARECGAGPAQPRRGGDPGCAEAARPHHRPGRAHGRADAAPEGLRPLGPDPAGPRRRGARRLEGAP